MKYKEPLQDVAYEYGRNGKGLLLRVTKDGYISNCDEVHEEEHYGYPPALICDKTNGMPLKVTKDGYISTLDRIEEAEGCGRNITFFDILYDKDGKALKVTKDGFIANCDYVEEENEGRSISGRYVSDLYILDK